MVVTAARVPLMVERSAALHRLSTSWQTRVVDKEMIGKVFEPVEGMSTPPYVECNFREAAIFNKMTYCGSS